MQQTQTLSEIINSISSEMERLHYSHLTIREFQRQAEHFRDYVLDTTSQDYFTEEIGSVYLKQKIGFPFEPPHVLTTREAAHIRCISRIGEYQMHGLVVKRRMNRYDAVSDWELNDKKIIDEYLNAMQTADNSEATKKLRTDHIRRFYRFLESSHLQGIENVTEKVISDYVFSLQGYSPVFVKHLLGSLRNYFRFVYKKEYINCDWSFSVPRVTVAKNRNIPELWDKEKVEKLLQSIDRGNPAGKRDYAIIMLVAELGLRISDISSLKLKSLRWEKYEIDYIQHKTKKRAIQPVSKETGWAIIDYLRHGRADVDEPFVFLTVIAPYTQITPGAVGSILARARKRCGMQKKPGTVSGMHSLRHALARKLIEHNTELSVVADIMGHSSYSSTSPYLKVDIEGMRRCAISLENEVIVSDE